MTQDVLERLAGASERLQTRRLVKFPLVDVDEADCIFTEVQGRGWGSDSTMSVAEIGELISSIATIGLLQPIQLEQQPDGGHLLVAGERRLRALRWGSINHPDNPHFHSVTAVVVDGPLTEEEKRRWQLIENLARQDLKPGELAAALLYERSAMLADKLRIRDIDPTKAMALEDPAERWEALSKTRLEAELHGVGVGWPELIQHLGLSLSAGRAEQLVRAFRAMPQDLSSEMDANDVSLASRQEWVRLSRGRQAAADDIWEALRGRGRTDLLTRSCKEALTHPGAETAEVIDLAETIHERTGRAGSESISGAADDRGGSLGEVDAEVVTRTITSLEELVERLRAGQQLPGYAGGSLRLHLRELAAQLDDQRLAS